MTCRDAINLLPLFFDGELDSRQMRAVAIHSSRCRACEAELRELESLQAMVNTTVSRKVDEMDLSNLWGSIESRLPDRRLSALERLQRWWEETAPTWRIRVPALAAAAVVAALAFLFLTRVPEPGLPPAAPQIAIADNNEAMIDSLDTEADSVAVMSDPETRTTVLWVSDDYILEDVGP